MPYKDLEKKRECGREWARKNRHKQKEWYEKNRESVLLRTREWWQEHKRKPGILEERRKYGEKHRKENLKKYSEKAKKWRQNNPHKIKAQQLAQLIKIKPCCEICGSVDNLERHHWNYDKPFLVNTLCRSCHRIQHARRIEHPNIY